MNQLLKISLVALVAVGCGVAALHAEESAGALKSGLKNGLKNGAKK